VLDAQRQLFSAELELASTTRDQLAAVVQLYKALGGGMARSAYSRLQSVAMTRGQELTYSSRPTLWTKGKQTFSDEGSR
jgi:hypothetical protein